MPSQHILHQELDASIPTPAAGTQAMFLRSATSRFGRKDSTGVVYDIFPPTLNYVDAVADLGCDNTGVTDCTTIINNYLTATSAAVPTAIFFPAGTYKIATSGTGIVLNRHTWIYGSNRYDTIFSINHATATGFTLAEWYCQINDVRIDSGVTRTGGYAIDDAGFNFLRVDRVQVNNQWSGIRLAGHECSLHDVHIFDSGDRQHGTPATGAALGAGILMDAAGSSAHDMYLEDIIVSNAAKPTTFSGLRIIQCASLTMSGCQFIQCDNAMEIAPTNAKVVPSVFAVNCFLDNSNIGLNLAGSGTGTIQRLKFVNCWMSSGTTGAKLNNANQIQGCDFVNCDFYQNANGIDAIAFQDFMVRGSRFSGNTVTGVLVTANANHTFSISDNFIGNGSGFGANALGINIQAGTYKAYQVQSNRGLESNTTPGITDAGTTTLAYNKNAGNNLGAMKAGALAAITATVTTAGTGLNLIAQARIPANAFPIGQVFKARLYGTTAALGNPTFTAKAGVLGTTGDANVLAVGPVTSASAATVVFAEFYFTITAIGSSGNIRGNAMTTVGTTATNATSGLSATLNTTADWFLSIYVTMSASTMSVFQCVIEAV